MRSHVRRQSEREDRHDDRGEADSRAETAKRARVALKAYSKQLSHGELSQARLEAAFLAGIQAYDWARKQ